MGREMGEPWNFSQHQPLLEACLRHPSDSLRLSTLGLCVDSHSSVEAFSRPELDLIRGFLLRSLVLSSPASRQEEGRILYLFIYLFSHYYTDFIRTPSHEKTSLKSARSVILNKMRLRKTN
jgi:hypothetical protein